MHACSKAASLVCTDSVHLVEYFTDICSSEGRGGTGCGAVLLCSALQFPSATVVSFALQMTVTRTPLQILTSLPVKPTLCCLMIVAIAAVTHFQRVGAESLVQGGRLCLFTKGVRSSADVCRHDVTFWLNGELDRMTRRKRLHPCCSLFSTLLSCWGGGGGALTYAGTPLTIVQLPGSRKHDPAA